MKRALAPILLCASGLALAYWAAGPAGAEQSGHGGVQASLDGHVRPKTLPRHGLAPVSVFLSGGAHRSDGQAPPRLRQIELAFGARGGLESAGLPRCRRSRLRNATMREAIARCGRALVGRGSILTEVPLAPSQPLRARARALAFNARKDGHPAVWLYAYSASPPVSLVLPFSLRRLERGSYGVLLTAPVGRALGRWPRIRSFQITLGRRYRSHGERRSYLNAACPLPPRFDHIDAPFARAVYRFAPGPAITVDISRPCRARQ